MSESGVLSDHVREEIDHWVERFPEKRKRMLVGAAGMMVELFLASVALFVWLAAEPGLVRWIAFDVMLIGGVSTLLFNGNPLLKFDGYYVLADAIRWTPERRSGDQVAKAP